MGRNYCVLLMKKEPRRSSPRRPSAAPFLISTKDKIFVSSQFLASLINGDDEAFEEVRQRFLVRGNPPGEYSLQVALGGKGKMASLMPKNTDWCNTGFPKLGDLEL